MCMLDFAMLDFAMQELSLIVRFEGGLELLFGHVKDHAVCVPVDATLRFVIQWLHDNLLQERPELFLSGGNL